MRSHIITIHKTLIVWAVDSEEAVRLVARRDHASGFSSPNAKVVDTKIISVGGEGNHQSSTEGK